MNNSLYQKDIISMRDFSKHEIDLVLRTAAYFKTHPSPTHHLRSKILASLFLEPSTRTRLSFEAAMYRLSGHVLSVSDSQETSIAKGESLSDTIKVISSYADIIVLRHPCEGAARLAAEATTLPVINAGDGANEHPSQTLLDLFSLKESQSSVDGLKIAFVGDLKYSRTIHSLALAATHYNLRMYFVSPDSLTLPDRICHELKAQGVQYSFHLSLEELLPKLDVLYMTRLQKERFQDVGDLDTKHDAHTKNIYVLKPHMLKNVKPNFKVLSPLPRLHEIDVGVDATPYAYYFQQAANGLFVRQALLSLVLQEEPLINVDSYELERTSVIHSSH